MEIAAVSADFTLGVRMVLGVPAGALLVLTLAVVEHVGAHVLLDRGELARSVLDA